MSEQAKPYWSKKEIGLGILGVVVTVALCVAAVLYKNDLVKLMQLSQYSLLGMLIIALFAGSVLSLTAIPVPYWLFTFTLPSLLASRWGIMAPIWIGLVSALGVSISQFITFMIGYGGRHFSERITCKINNSVYLRALGWMQRHGSWAVFGMSATFNPVHLPMTLAIAALRYPPPKFLLFSFLGNTVKSFILAFGGYFGLTSLFHFIGV